MLVRAILHPGARAGTFAIVTIIHSNSWPNIIGKLKMALCKSSFTSTSSRWVTESFRVRFFTWLAVIVVLWISGCATTRESQLLKTAKAPNVRLGPVHELLNVTTVRDKVRVVLDRSGLGHVVVALTGREEVHHIVVGPKGVLERDVIRSSASPSTIDIAFDAAGRLHVLIDDEHLVKEDDLWRKLERTPWKEAGFEVAAPRFVPGAPNLTWAFAVGGKDVGAPMRWDLFGFGGYGVGIIWPSRVSGRKLAVVRESDSTYATWAILDLQDPWDVTNWRLATGVKDTVHIIYDAASTFIVSEHRPRYAQFTVHDQSSEIASEADNAGSSEKRRFVQQVTGHAIGQITERSTGGWSHQASMAADPATGTVLVLKAHTASWLIRNNTLSDRIQLPLGSTWWNAGLAPGGNDRFHALVVGKAQNVWIGKGFAILYMEFAQGAWSAPVDLGVADVSAFWGSIWDAVQLASNGKPEALAVWPVEESIVARWISQVQ